MTVYLDTNGVIDLIEPNPVWSPKIINRLALARQAGDQVATSDLSRTECLAHPFASGNAALIADYLAFFGDPQVQMLTLTSAVCERGGGGISCRIRFQAEGARPPSAWPPPSSMAAGLFLTNDADLVEGVP